MRRSGLTVWLGLVLDVRIGHVVALGVPRVVKGLIFIMVVKAVTRRSRKRGQRSLRLDVTIVVLRGSSSHVSHPNSSNLELLTGYRSVPRHGDVQVSKTKQAVRASLMRIRTEGHAAIAHD